LNGEESVIEKVMDILMNLKNQVDDDRTIQDIDYCIDNITNGKLYAGMTMNAE
jgi:hypothetical protein